MPNTPARKKQKTVAQSLIWSKNKNTASSLTRTNMACLPRSLAQLSCGKKSKNWFHGYHKRGHWWKRSLLFILPCEPSCQKHTFDRRTHMVRWGYKNKCTLPKWLTWQCRGKRKNSQKCTERHISDVSCGHKPKTRRRRSDIAVCLAL